LNKLLGKILGSRWTKVVVFVACLVPFLLLLVPFVKLITTGNAPELTANPVEYITHDTGTWTIRFLLITLCVTPMRNLLSQPKLVRYRRMFGLFAFFYVCLHFMTWFILDKSFSFSDMWADVLKRRFITVGMLGFAMLIPLAITSTAGWVRRMGFVKWQRLHRLIYFTALAGVIHYYWLVKSDVRLPLMYGAILTVLMLYRFFIWNQTRPNRTAPLPAAESRSAVTTPNRASLPD
jgi:methionine sulfoxide reductase heme-binding subunit